MVTCRGCNLEINSGEKIVVQYEGTMMYEGDEAAPARSGAYARHWHKRCKPWHD